MNDFIKNAFKNKKPIPSKLIKYGFEYSDGVYKLTKSLLEAGFEMTVSVDETGDVSAQIFDTAMEEIYTLHLADGAQGSFVGGIRSEYEEILSDISLNCFELNVFKSPQSLELIEYARSKYGDELEFLWEKFQGNAILRRKDSGKWYCLFMILPKSKLGLASDDKADMIDLRFQPDGENPVDGKNFFPGWHMSKKSWYTVILDGRVDIDVIKEKLDESYALAATKKKRK